MLSDEEAFQFDLQGYLVLKRALSRERVLALGERIAELDNRGPDELPWSIPVWTPVINEYRILNVLDPCRRALDFVDDETILARLDGLLEAPYRLTEAYTITRSRGIGLYLHNVPEPLSTYRVRDGRPRCTYVKVTIPLTDCGDDDGPFVVLEGSHKSGVELPYSRLDPEWDYPDRDRGVLETMRGHEAGKVERAWKSIPGYRELPVDAGDVVIFTESLIHGAKATRANRRRRGLHLGYGPYSCTNWHGVRYSDELLASSSERQRRLLSGPFVGFRYESALTTVPDDPSFPFYPNSEVLRVT